MAEAPGSLLDRSVKDERQPQTRPEGGTASKTPRDPQLGKAAAAAIEAKRDEGGDPTTVLRDLAAGEIAAEKPLLPKVQEQADKMKALAKEHGIDDLRINIEEDEAYKKLVDKYKKQLSVEDFKDRYRGFSDPPEFFRDREARIQALEEFAHDPATAEAAKLYKQHSVWFDDNGNPDSSRDVYYERAGKEAEDQTRKKLLEIQPNPIYKQHVRPGVEGDEERHREGQRLFDMQQQFPELYFTAVRDAYQKRNQTLSQEVKNTYGNQETATRDVFAQEQLDWLRDVDKDVFNNGASAVHRSLVVKAFLGPDAPEVKDENIIRQQFVVDTVSPSGQELVKRIQQGWEQVRGNQSISRRIIEMILETKAEIDAQQKAKEAPPPPPTAAQIPTPGEQPSAPASVQSREPAQPQQEQGRELASSIAEDPVYLSLLNKYKRISLGKYRSPDGSQEDVIDRAYPEGVKVGNSIGEDELKALKEFEDLYPQRAAEYRKKSIDDFKGGDRENVGVKLYRAEVPGKIVKAQEDALQGIKDQAASQGKTEAEQFETMAEQFWQIRYGEELKGYDAFYTELGSIDDQGPDVYWFRENLQEHVNNLEWQFKDPTTVAYYKAIAKAAIAEKFGYPPGITKEQLNQEFETASSAYESKYPTSVAPSPWATDSYREKIVQPISVPPVVPVPSPVPQEKGFVSQIADAMGINPTEQGSGSS